MTLFHWKSKAVGGYYAGDIIVSAPSVVSAKRKVIANAKKTRNGSNESWIALLKEDLKKDPEIISSNVMFITGSD